jgi:ParB-like chromosome segregation protein Spo0J
MMPLFTQTVKDIFDKMNSGYELTEAEKKIAFPCLYTQLVKADMVVYNDYNPNAVAPPEMRLLQHSIAEDGYTQPIVTIYDPESGKYTVVDGAHRYKNAIEIFKLKYVPIVVIDKDIKDRIASTIRHNRARGEHNVTQMSNIVAELVMLGWADIEIGRHLGMGADEVLRLKQNTGIAEIFKDHTYSQAWE